MAWFVRGRGVGRGLAVFAVAGWAVAILLLTGAGTASVVAAVRSGAGWQVQRLPSAASNGGEPDGVACPSVTTCTVFGAYGQDMPDQALVIRSREAKWSRQPAPSPSVADGGAIDSASLACPSRRVCVAVGSYDNAAFLTVPFAELWKGGPWGLQELPSPPGATTVDLNGVSCSSPSACMAVGSDELGSNGRFETLAERWDGRTWTIQPTPNPRGNVELNGISCTSRNACIAVGDAALNSPLVEVWNGGRWSIAKTPRIRLHIGLAALNGVSCTSRRTCVAVGFTETENEVGQSALIERSRGPRWARVAAPLGGELKSVSCASATACTAVGYAVERWDGSRWSTQRVRIPGGQAFTGVSCPAPTVCTAVGYHENEVGVFAFVERWTAK